MHPSAAYVRPSGGQWTPWQQGVAAEGHGAEAESPLELAVAWQAGGQQAVGVDWEVEEGVRRGALAGGVVEGVWACELAQQESLEVPLVGGCGEVWAR